MDTEDHEQGLEKTEGSEELKDSPCRSVPLLFHPLPILMPFQVTARDPAVPPGADSAEGILGSALAPFLHLLRAGVSGAVPSPPRTLKVAPCARTRALRPAEHHSPSCSSRLHFGFKMDTHSSTFLPLRVGVTVPLKPVGVTVPVTALRS